MVGAPCSSHSLIASGYFTCGVERQAIKVLRDAGASRLTLPQPLTVEQLVRARRPYGSRGRARVEHVVGPRSWAARRRANNIELHPLLAIEALRR